MSKKLRDPVKEDFIKIDETNPSTALLEQLKKIQGLPDDCFTSLAADDEVTVPISGRFLSVLRSQMAYLLDAEEIYTCLSTLTKIKEDFRDKNGKVFPPNKISLFDQALWANMTMITAISAAAVQQKKATVYDKNEFFSAVDAGIQGKSTSAEAEPLDEVELAKRAGLKVDLKGEFSIDEDYIKNKTNEEEYINLGNTEVDIVMKRKFNETSESIDKDSSKLDPSAYAKHPDRRKENIRNKRKRDEDV